MIEEIRQRRRIIYSRSFSNPGIDGRRKRSSLAIYDLTRFLGIGLNFQIFTLIHDRGIKRRRNTELVIEPDVSFLRLEIKSLVLVIVFEQICKSPVSAVSCTPRRKFTTMD